LKRLLAGIGNTTKKPALGQGSITTVTINFYPASHGRGKLLAIEMNGVSFSYERLCYLRAAGLLAYQTLIPYGKSIQ